MFVILDSATFNRSILEINSHRVSLFVCFSLYKQIDKALKKIIIRILNKNSQKLTSSEHHCDSSSYLLAASLMTADVFVVYM